MVLVVAVVIIQLDRYFLEASLSASRRHYEHLARLRRSGGTSAARLRGEPRYSLPDFPRLSGAGTIAWRQSLETIRRSGGLLFLGLAPAVIGLIVAAATFSAGDEELPNVGIALGATLFVGLLVSTGLPLGLRSDLDYVDVIKTLPMTKESIVWGSIGAALLYITVVQLIANLTIALLLGHGVGVIALAMGVALPINLLLVTIDSVLVLLFPSIRVFTPGDIFVGVRIVLVNFAKMASVVLVGGAAGAASPHRPTGTHRLAGGLRHARLRRGRGRRPGHRLARHRAVRSLRPELANRRK